MKGGEGEKDKVEAGFVYLVFKRYGFRNYADVIVMEQ